MKSDERHLNQRPFSIENLWYEVDTERRLA